MLARSRGVCVLSRGRFHKCCSHRPVAGSVRPCFSHSGSGPQGRGYIPFCSEALPQPNTDEHQCGCPPDPCPDCKQATLQTSSKNDFRDWAGVDYSRSVATGGSALVATSAFDDSSRQRYDKLWRINVLRVIVSFLFRIAILWISAHGIWYLVAGQ
jgi:hypothetical protein